MKFFLVFLQEVCSVLTFLFACNLQSNIDLKSYLDIYVTASTPLHKFRLHNNSVQNLFNIFYLIFDMFRKMCYLWVTLPNLSKIFRHDRFPQTENFQKKKINFGWYFGGFHLICQTCPKKDHLYKMTISPRQLYTCSSQLPA